jgi:hypothetical protein
MSPINDSLTRYGLRPPNPWGNPHFSGQEVIEDLTRNFNQMPPQFTTDPQTGQTIVTKQMPKPYGPPDLDAPYTNLFLSPNNPNWGMDDPYLRSSWLLPEGAMTGPKFLDRSAPTSDAARQMGELTGISNVGASTSTLNPQTHWPESTFKVPQRDPSFWGDPYGPPEPVFNSVTDFARGRTHTPPTPGNWSQSYTPIDGGVPGYGSDMIPPVMPTDINRILRQSLLRRSVNV